MGKALPKSYDRDSDIDIARVFEMEGLDEEFPPALHWKQSFLSVGFIY